MVQEKIYMRVWYYCKKDCFLNSFKIFKYWISKIRKSLCSTCMTKTKKNNFLWDAKNTASFRDQQTIVVNYNTFLFLEFMYTTKFKSLLSFQTLSHWVFLCLCVHTLPTGIVFSIDCSSSPLHCCLAFLVSSDLLDRSGNRSVCTNQPRVDDVAAAVVVVVDVEDNWNLKTLSQEVA